MTLKRQYKTHLKVHYMTHERVYDAEHPEAHMVVMFDEYTIDHDAEDMWYEEGGMIVIKYADGREIQMPKVNIRRIESMPEWVEVGE